METIISSGIRYAYGKIFGEGFTFLDVKQLLILMRLVNYLEYQNLHDAADRLELVCITAPSSFSV